MGPSDNDAREDMNYKPWAAKPVWSLEEAAALLLQRGPSAVNIRSLGLEELRLLEGPVRFSEYQHDARNKNDESQQQKRQ